MDHTLNDGGVLNLSGRHSDGWVGACEKRKIGSKIDDWDDRDGCG